RGTDLREPSARARFVEDLRTELKQQTYRPSPVLRKYIPKANGGERPIGIPTLKDRTVQMALKMVLEPIFEADFLPNSNGFRPERSTLECVLPMYRYGDSHINYSWIIEGDIEGCFDNIDHSTLMEAVQNRIADRRILWLIRRFLKAPVIDNGARTKPQKGTPQGGVLSPLLANIYLNEFDQFWYDNWGRLTAKQRRRQRQSGQASCVLFRYADDFILSVKGSREEAITIMDSIRRFFKEKLSLNLSAEKTRVVPLESGFDFLGFHIRRAQLDRGKCVRIRPTQKSLSRLKAKLQSMLGPSAGYDDPHMKIGALNRVLRGWVNYYKAVNSSHQLWTGDFLAERLFRQWYRRKYGMGVREYLSKVRKGSRVVLWRGDAKVELYRMSSNKSTHSSLNSKLVWKYRSIRNPYIKPNGIVTNALDTDENPIIDMPDALPILAPYDDENYLVNRFLAFERDGWKCTRCGSRENLQAHHIEPVPQTPFDPLIIHRIENLQTLCKECHSKAPKKSGSHARPNSKA
ncbi:MAG TPA: group II intron reverse transcriptase/maturase, partial [Nitrososphaerales archaeon]|nr:group II intron reverse transcriptase/maturase [Nitrososphaerales archaeon]